VALGSDYPFPLGEASPGAGIRAAGFDVTTTRQLLSKNARAWLASP
jgi:hypothetical protein